MSASPYPSGGNRFVTDAKSLQVIADHVLTCDGSVEPAITSTQRCDHGTSRPGPAARVGHHARKPRSSGRAPLPAVGGREGAGRVAELGAGTRGVTVGQLVLLPLGCGTWSTHVVTEAAQLTPLPGEADPLQLSMMTINPPTAALLLSEFVTLGPGEWVIQNAANSAVGLYLVQLARRRGHRSVNVVRREDAATAVREADGDAVLIDGEDLAKRVTEATGGAAIRLGIDAVARAASGRLAGCLDEGATLVSYGRMSGEATVIPSEAFIFRDLTLCGFWLARWFRHTSAAAPRAPR